MRKFAQPSVGPTKLRQLAQFPTVCPTMWQPDMQPIRRRRHCFKCDAFAGALSLGIQPCRGVVLFRLKQPTLPEICKFGGEPPLGSGQFICGRW